MRRSLLIFLGVFALLFPLAWANQSLYTQARELAGLRARVAAARRAYDLSRVRLAEEERLGVIQARAVEMGMRYPEEMRFDKDEVHGAGSGPLEPGGGFAPGVASVVGGQ